MGLSQKVVEVPENRLAFDFADGDHVQYSPPSGHPSQGTVERSDTSRWCKSVFQHGIPCPLHTPVS